MPEDPSTIDLLSEVDPAALCSFERPVPNTPIKPLHWSIEKYEAAQLLALSRMTMAQVSQHLRIPLHALQRWKTHPDFREYMDKVTLDTESTLKALRLQVLRKILDARLDLVEESGNYAALSSKDTLDILDALRKETEAADTKPESNYLKTIEDLLKRTQERQALAGASPKLPE